jgi:hypothetical protein
MSHRATCLVCPNSGLVGELFEVHGRYNDDPAVIKCPKCSSGYLFHPGKLTKRGKLHPLTPAEFLRNVLIARRMAE